MKQFSLFSLFFLITINKINSDNQKEYSIYETCPQGSYGMNCEKDCQCNKWSSSINCSRINGRCLDCKFGHFDFKCENICYPKCKTNLCCAVNSKDYKKSNKEIKSDISYLSIKIGEQTLKIYADYNVGYPLTIFKNTLNETLPLDGKIEKNEEYSYTIDNENVSVNGVKYENNTISILNNNGKTLDLNLSILLDEIIKKEDIPEGINGVIGLGFSNSINIELLQKKAISLNIASYEINNGKISILFGNLFDEEKKYVHKLSYCNAKLNKLNHTIMKCQVEGMKPKPFSNALKMENLEVEFSLNKQSSFVLSDSSDIKDYIKKYYFKNKNYYKENKSNGTYYYCFKSNKINKLNNFGFVINQYYFSYQADRFFIDSNLCENGYQKFIIEFSNNTEIIGIVFGQNLSKDLQFTIDNEERKIYYYSRNVEYFSGEINKDVKSAPSINTDPFVLSLIFIGGVFLLNILSFLVYFYFKRKKEKIN